MTRDEMGGPNAWRMIWLNGCRCCWRSAKPKRTLRSASILRPGYAPEHERSIAPARNKTAIQDTLFWVSSDGL